MSPLTRLLCFVLFHAYLAGFSLSQEYIGDNCKDSEGRDGICVRLSACEYAREDLKKGIKPKHCGFEYFSPIVCCSIRKPGDISKYKCHQYLQVCPNYYPIAGGTLAIPGEYPHMAAVGYGDENTISWQCGGSLISERFVLTAAHCLSSSETGPAWWVLLGTEKLINSISSGGESGQIHPVIKRIRHPEYKPPSKYNDIALLEIGNAVTQNARTLNSFKLHPVCLPTPSESSANYKAIATGWGRIGSFDDRSSDLLKVEVDVLSTDICNKSYEIEIGTTNILRRGIDSTLVCAGVLEGGKDTCQGDSGGPLQNVYRLNCMFNLLGVTSFGKVCATKNSPSVYTRVGAYIPWIESIVWPQLWRLMAKEE